MIRCLGVTRISINAVRALVGAVESFGVPRERFLSEAGLSTAQLDDGDGHLSLAAYRLALRAALVTSGNPALGLHMGAQIGSAKFGVLGYLVEQAGCLREALEIGSRYVRIFVDGPRVELEERGDTATIRCLLICDGLPEIQLTAEFVTTWLLRLVRQFVADAALPRAVSFSYEAPPHRAAYTRAFGGREQFSQGFIGLEIERSWLDRAQPHRSTELRQLLMARADQLLVRMDRQAPLVERVRRCLSSHALQTRPTMTEVARDLGMSARSLRRHLSGQRVPYHDLVEEARSRRAKDLLADPQCSVQEASYALGFESPGAFTRAFKRWTGTAPTVYRAPRETPLASTRVQEPAPRTPTVRRVKQTAARA